MDALIRTIDTAIRSKNYSQLAAVFSSYGPHSWQSVGPGEQRSLAAHLIVTAVNSEGFLEPALEDDRMMQVLVQALSHLPAHVDGAADSVLRQALFTQLVSQEDYAGAARILASMRMEDESSDTSSPYYMEPAARCDVYVKIAECFLAQDEIAESDAAVNKAGSVVEAIVDKHNHMALLLRYKSTYARVLDANRKFLAAAGRYHELSQSTATDLIDEEELVLLLGRAATCAILAPAGPQRQRVLGLIAADPRLPRLESMDSYGTHPIILHKMVTHQIIQPTVLVQFEAGLADHQKAIMGDGLTIMERGVVEHNMIAVSKLYRSIYMDELARILGVTVKKAEKIAADMVVEGSVKGAIDQVDGLLEFEPEETPDQAWDRSITDFCQDLNIVANAIRETTAMA